MTGPPPFYDFGSVFWSELRINTFVLDKAIFPRWFDSRRTGITACQLWEMISNAERTRLNIFGSHKIATMPNLRDIRHGAKHSPWQPKVTLAGFQKCVCNSVLVDWYLGYRLHRPELKPAEIKVHICSNRRKRSTTSRRGGYEEQGSEPPQ